MTIMDEDSWTALDTEERVEFVREKFKDFVGFCHKSMVGVIKKSRPNFSENSPEFKQIFNAFLMRVQDFCAVTAVGGHAIDHLPIDGIITQEEYCLLNAEAAHLAATLFDHLKFEKHAMWAHAECSRWLGKARGTEAYLRHHLDIV